MRTLTAYGIGVVIVLAALNGIAWRAGMLRLHGLNVFSAGFVLGVLGTCIAAWLYGYRKIADGRNQPQAGLVSKMNISAPPVAKVGTSAAAACPSALPNAF